MLIKYIKGKCLEDRVHSHSYYEDNLAGQRISYMSDYPVATWIERLYLEMGLTYDT